MIHAKRGSVAANGEGVSAVGVMNASGRSEEMRIEEEEKRAPQARHRSNQPLPLAALRSLSLEGPRGHLGRPRRVGSFDEAQLEGKGKGGAVRLKTDDDGGDASYSLHDGLRDLTQDEFQIRRGRDRQQKKIYQYLAERDF